MQNSFRRDTKCSIITFLLIVSIKQRFFHLETFIINTRVEFVVNENRELLELKCCDKIRNRINCQGYAETHISLWRGMLKPKKRDEGEWEWEWNWKKQWARRVTLREPRMYWNGAVVIRPKRLEDYEHYKTIFIIIDYISVRGDACKVNGIIYAWDAITIIVPLRMFTCARLRAPRWARTAIAKRV